MNDQFPFLGQGFPNTLGTTVKGNMGGPNTGSIYIYNSIAQLDPDSYKKQSIVFLIGVGESWGPIFLKVCLALLTFSFIFNRELHKLHGSRNCFHMISKHIDMEDVFFSVYKCNEKYREEPGTQSKKLLHFWG